MKKYVFRLEMVAETREKAKQLFLSGGAFKRKIEERELTDEDIEELWRALGDVPVDEDGKIENPFLKWNVGADREDIWHWFDENHSEGVTYLMGIE